MKSQNFKAHELSEAIYNRAAKHRQQRAEFISLLPIQTEKHCPEKRRFEPAKCKHVDNPNQRWRR